VRERIARYAVNVGALAKGEERSTFHQIRSAFFLQKTVHKQLWVTTAGGGSGSRGGIGM